MRSTNDNWQKELANLESKQWNKIEVMCKKYINSHTNNLAFAVQKEHHANKSTALNEDDLALWLLSQEVATSLEVSKDVMQNT